MKKIVINDLFDYPKMKIYQDEDYFKFSLDSVLLGEFVENPKINSTILDLCTGNAPVPLILSTKYKNKIYGFEIQPNIYDLAIKSVEINNKNDQIHIINDDVNNIKNYFPGNNFDIITCNPPYFRYQNSSLINENREKSLARHEITVNLEQIIKIAADYLNNKGSFYLVHRAERLDEIITLCMNNSLAVKKIQLIATNKTNSPSTVLIKAVKNGNLGVKILPVINVSNLSTYQKLFEVR